MKPFLIGLSYNHYRPGMKLFLDQEHEGLKENEVVEILEVNGYDPDSGVFTFPKRPDEYFFIVEQGIKIVWNQVKISCWIERNETTEFLESMFAYYEQQAKLRLEDTRNYEWSQSDYDRFLDEKFEILSELLEQYEWQRVLKRGGLGAI